MLVARDFSLRRYYKTNWAKSVRYVVFEKWQSVFLSDSLYVRYSKSIGQIVIKFNTVITNIAGQPIGYFLFLKKKNIFRIEDKR